MFNAHLTEFAGLPVVEYVPPTGTTAEHGGGRAAPRRHVRGAGPGTPADVLSAPGAAAWRLVAPFEYEASGAGPAEYFGRFFAEVDPGAVTALVIGGFPNTINTGRTEPVLDALLEHAPRLTGLRSLFFADLIYLECEVSWMRHGDLAPLLDALPSLESFAVRGCGRTALAVEEHPSLRSLTLQGGGLPAELTGQVLASRYPALAHLELWLGIKSYGGDTVPEDLAPLLDGDVHTGVRSLGLRNAHRTDRWVRAVADAPVLDRLEELDLSMGTLTDEGAQTLLDTPGFRRLRRLDLHHHYMTEDMEQRVLEAFTAAGVETDATGRKEPREAQEWGDEEPEDEEEAELWEAEEWEERYYPSVTE